MQTYTPRLRELTLTYRVFATSPATGSASAEAFTDADEASRLLTAILADEPSEVFGMLSATSARLRRITGDRGRVSSCVRVVRPAKTDSSHGRW